MATFDEDEEYEPIQCFISYARADNDTYNGVADEFKARLKGIYEAKTGRTLRVFVDRDSIGWGEDWRARIGEAVKSATVFIPLISMKYFTRSACREELMAFYQSARLIGVTDLILPVILAGGRGITESDPRDEVRIVERLNHISVEDALPLGFKSSEWMSSMNKIAEALIESVRRAENRIANLESHDEGRMEIPESVASRRPTDGSSSAELAADADENDEDAAGGIFHVMETYQAEMEALNKSTTRAVADLTEFSDLFRREFAALGPEPTRAIIAKNAARIASAILESSSRLGDSGSEVLEHATKSDAAIRRIISDVSSVGVPALRQSMDSAMAQVTADLSNTGEVIESMEETIQSIKFAQLISVSLRRALTPAYKGMTSIRDAIRLVVAWREISY